MSEETRRRGRPPLNRSAGPKRASFGTRISPDLKAALEARASAAGRSLSEEIELRLHQSIDREGMLGEVFMLAYGEYFGIVRFFGELIRCGGGSTAAIEALRLLQVPDVHSDPRRLAHELIELFGYIRDHDPEMARRSGVNRWVLGDEASRMLADAYGRLRAETVAGSPDPKITSMWYEAFDRAREEDKQ